MKSMEKNVRKPKGPFRATKPLPYGVSFTEVHIGGRWAKYENAGTPENIPIYRALCEVCHNASSYLMLRKPPTVKCISCKEDQIAMDALRVQKECGVDLGWRTPALVERRDHLSPRQIEHLSHLKRRYK